MTELAKLPWTEAQHVLGERSVVLLPIGSTEPHGPHLPLDTDVTIAQAQSRRAAERLEAADVTAVVLPAIPFGITHFTNGFAGWITLKPATLWHLVEDVIESLEDHGVRRVVLSNGHLEPAHVEVLRGVASDRPAITRTKAQVLFPDNTRRRWAETLGAEFQSGDCHAGRYESSLVLAADPAHVRDEARRALPPVQVDLVSRTKAGAKSFREIGASAAYCGDPAAASAREGVDLIESLASMIVQSAREAWPELFR